MTIPEAMQESAVSATGDIATGADKTAQPKTNPFYFAVWRWHFYAGLYVVPFMIMLAVTGILMMIITAVDGRDGEKITVTPQGEPLSIAIQEQSALNAIPDGKIIQWIGPVDETRAAVFRVKADKVNHMVAVNPYDGEVVESWIRRDGWYDFIADIHGELLIGVTGDRLIEIAASFGIMLVVTGLNLWWPRGNQSWTQMLIPNFRVRGRRLWKSLHSVTGFWIGLLLIVFLLSGLAWAGIWGGKFVQPWSTFPVEKNKEVPLSDITHAAMNHGAIKEVPWGLELAPMPASGSLIGDPAIPEGMPVTVDTVRAYGESVALPGRFRISYPKGETGVWTVSQGTSGGDIEKAFGDRTIHIDRYTGKVLANIGFSDYSLVAKSMAVGIPFHKGEIGVWNFVLTFVFCLALIFVSVSGVVMWWIRRPEKTSRLAAPPMPANLPLWKGAVVIMLFLSLAFPLMGVTLLVVLTLDYLLLSRVPSLQRLAS